MDLKKVLRLVLLTLSLLTFQIPSKRGGRLPMELRQTDRKSDLQGHELSLCPKINHKNLIEYF